LIPPIEIDLREGFPASQDERRRALSWAFAYGISSCITLPRYDFPCAVERESGQSSCAVL